jgi:predicted nuclease of predicted toxin-antitoxin system
MKLLFDQNISFRILSKIKAHFPEAKQVRQLGIENYSDIEIWKFAKENKFTNVTFDADFFDLSNLKGQKLNGCFLVIQLLMFSLLF